MDFDVDPGTVLYALGAILGLAALVYFMRDLVFGLSITVKAILLLLAFAAFLVGGLATDRDVVDLVALSLAGGAYLAFLAYVNNNYSIGETGTFLLLALSAALFVGLGYALHEREVAVPVRTAAYVVGAAFLVSLVLVGADAATGDVQYEPALNDTVTVEPPAQSEPGDRYRHLEARIGTVTASNPFVFTRKLDPPQTSACVATPETGPTESQHVGYSYPQGYDDWPRTIGGGETVDIAMTTHLRTDANRTSPLTFAVERGTSCPDDVSEPTIVVAFGQEEENFRPRPVDLAAADG